MTNSKNLTSRLSVSALLLLSFAFGAADAMADTKATGKTIVGLSSEAESAKTTLHIRGSGTPTFTVYKLENPSRIVVDMVGSSLSAKLRKGDDKATWSINSWAVGQVSAHNMSKSSGELVRVVVGLSRPSSYQVKASGNDVVVEVTAKSKPTGIDPALLQRAKDESASARKAAEKELASARAEADRIRKQAAERETEAKARIAEAERLMAEATSKSDEALKAQRIANAEIASAQAREQSAKEAEARAIARQDAVTKSEEAARVALAEAEKARSKNQGDSAKLQARAEAASRATEQRRKQAEDAMRLAESRRQAAEEASELAETRRVSAATALKLAKLERKTAEAERDSAVDSSKSADDKRRSAEAAAEAAAKRAQELRQLVEAEETRFESARTLRTQEEAAVAKARSARSVVDQQSNQAALAQQKLSADILALSKVKRSAEARRQAAETALAQAEKAAADNKVSKNERARLKSEAHKLGIARDQAVKALANQERALRQQRQEVEALNQKKQSAAQGLLALQQEANAVRDRRAEEEKNLSALSAKRADMKGQLDQARKMRILAKDELEQARQARQVAESARIAALKDAKAAQQSKAAAQLARNEATQARNEATQDALAAKDARARAQVAEADAQNELEMAKRARLSAESERQAMAEQMKLANEQEAAAKARVTESQRARKSAQSDRQLGAAAIAKAQSHEDSALKALEQARAERELAEAARKKGVEALKLAAEREEQAAKTLAMANKSKASIKVVEPKTRLSDLDVVQRSDMSRVVIAMSSPAAPTVISNRGNEAVLEIPLAAIRDDQERTLDTSSLRGAVKAVSSYRDPKNPNNLKIVVDLTGPSTGTLKKVGNTYYWDFPAPEQNLAAAEPARSKAKSTSYRAQAVAGYGSASSPITQQTVAQLSNRRRKTYSGQKIDLDYKKSDIHDLMRLLADVGGVNIIVPDDIKARVTIRLRRVPWDQALDVILASKGLGFKMEGPKLFRIATQKELDAEFEAKLARAKAKAESEPPTPEIFNLNYVSAAQVQAQLASLLSPKGSLQVDTRSNALIINDVAANRRRIIEMLTRLDSQTPQVQIEARIVEARSTFVRQFGIQWGGNISASAAGGNATGLIFPSSIGLAGAADDGQTPVGGLSAAPSDFAVNLPAAIGTGSGGGIGLSLGSVGGNLGLNLRLSALEDEGSVRIISSPKITTSNNIEANIKSGVSIPVSVVSANGVQTQFVPADLELKVKPSVSLRDCAVSMDIQVKKNEADFVNTGARGDPTLLTKEAKTTILVQDGDTSVIGGIYTRNSGMAYSKVPFFGDLPVVGWLFKTTRENDERTEVLIFITPKITNRAFLPCSE